MPRDTAIGRVEPTSRSAAIWRSSCAGKIRRGRCGPGGRGSLRSSLRDSARIAVDLREVSFTDSTGVHCLLKAKAPAETLE